VATVWQILGIAWSEMATFLFRLHQSIEFIAGASAVLFDACAGETTIGT
jgi:hypothetical protein